MYRSFIMHVQIIAGRFHIASSPYVLDRLGGEAHLLRSVLVYDQVKRVGEGSIGDWAVATPTVQQSMAMMNDGWTNPASCIMHHGEEAASSIKSSQRVGQGYTHGIIDDIISLRFRSGAW